MKMFSTLRNKNVVSGKGLKTVWHYEFLTCHLSWMCFKNNVHGFDFSLKSQVMIKSFTFSVRSLAVQLSAQQMSKVLFLFLFSLLILIAISNCLSFGKKNRVETMCYE